MKGYIKGIVTVSKYACERITKVYPVEQDYGEGYKKYTCPVCNEFNNRHQVTKGESNCPCCGVNLCWNLEECEE